jgi:hypothetical protein
VTLSRRNWHLTCSSDVQIHPTAHGSRDLRCPGPRPFRAEEGATERAVHGTQLADFF